VNLLL